MAEGEKKLGALARGEFGQPAEAARNLMQGPLRIPFDVLLGEVAGRITQLTEALGEVRRLSRDIEDVEIRNISDDAKLTLVAQYNRRIAEICREVLLD